MLGYKVVYVFFAYSWAITDITMTSHERHVVSNHGPFSYLFNSLYESISKSALLTISEGNALVTDEFPVQRASNVEKASTWWRHHGFWLRCPRTKKISKRPMASRRHFTVLVWEFKKYFAYVKWEILGKRFTFILIVGYTCMSNNDFINLPLSHHVTMTHLPFYHRVIWSYNFRV